MNRAEFEIMYNENYPKVVRLCMGYANGDEALAKDFTQEVFIKVWMNLKNFRNESSISTWIYRITVNTCLSQIRKSKKMKTYNDIPTHLEDNSFDYHNNDEQKVNALYKCINKLTNDNKTIILLELEGVPQQEIAKIMGLKHEAVRVRVHRIKNELTKCVKK